MTAKNVLLILVILLLAGTVPTWPYSRSWGYLPAVICVVTMFFLVRGR